ncbi:ABC transporter permease [Roseisalinus antarcticus]|uniref:Branched-chain amino acid transport system / permease component n=1 Tax=Roseisalinus antarcticus TaxID=254357 RepID=A0A1Y5SDU6_9RHOB|nr:ABC transporter permease [Roseisalinus antarcticus]SLN38111.1 Branched-chain amino acid transport system / permease component [Roseisalinus antarcticus]
MLKLEKRQRPSEVWSYATPVIAVLLTMVFGGLLFMALGKDPFVAIRTIFWDPLFSEFAFFYRPQLLVKGAPLVLIAIGLSYGFRAGIWNIGAEGQYIVGAIFAAAAGLALYPMEARWLIFPLMVLAGAFGGFLWAMIPGILKVRFGTNEILVSLMLVYVAEQLLASMALGALKNPEGFGFPGSRNLAQWSSSQNLEIVAGSGMHWGVVVAFLAVIGTYVTMSRHVLGFQIRLTGQSPRAAAFSGVNPARLVLVSLGVSGALAGLAGMFEVTGPAGQISIDFNAGYGFTAIIVAFLGRLHPIGIMLAGGLMALTYIGGEIAQSQLQMPAAAIQLFQGMLLFFLLAVDVVTHYRVRWRRPASARVAAE